MKHALAALLLLAPGTLFASDYTLKDEGDFLPQGHRVEFHDRYGWKGYEARFDFGLDKDGRSLSSGSKLWVKILKRDGGSWTYKCKASGDRALTANVNAVTGKGLSVVAQCPIDEKAFGKAVGLHQDDVGSPTLLFQALVQDGKVLPGAQRGLFFQPGGSIESSELKSYVAADDPGGLAVVFRSN